ncbi:hypothetical protein [Prosthecobacter sp.]|uniref:hypothetical protein n=1 Tax=Prosthecobacter sp. TaxID=1965333 RepID=UPI0037C70DE2
MQAAPGKFMRGGNGQSYEDKQKHVPAPSQKHSGKTSNGHPKPLLHADGIEGFGQMIAGESKENLNSENPDNLPSAMGQRLFRALLLKEVKQKPLEEKEIPEKCHHPTGDQHRSLGDHVGLEHQVTNPCDWRQADPCQDRSRDQNHPLGGEIFAIRMCHALL